MATALFSCSNLFDDIKVPSTDGKTVTITGCVGDSQGGNSRAGRMALPSSNFAATDYVVWATASDGSEANPGTVDSTNHTFTIALPLGKVWTITIEMQAKETEDSDFMPVLRGSYTYDHALTADDIATPVSIVITPILSGYGTINLLMSVASGVPVETVVISGLSSSPETYTLFDGGYTINKLGVPCGAYIVTIDFKKSDGLILYSTTQSINVFANMETDKWISNGGLSAIDSEGNFVVTESLVKSFALTQIYVGETPHDEEYSFQYKDPSDTNLGTSYEPLETLDEAFRRLTDDTKDYTIRISGTQSGNFTLGTTDDAPNFAAHSVTLCGTTGNTTDILDGDADGDNIGDDSVLTIATTVPITIRNLKITGGNATTNNEGRGQGGGIDVFMDGATITLDRGAFITENVAKIQGGGVYVFGKNNTLVMNDGSKISNNHITDCNTNTAAYGGVGVYFGCDYNNTAVNDRPTFTMNGGEISGHTCGSESSPVGAVSGMGLRLCKAVFIMNGGKITENSAVSNNGDKTLGGNIYAERSTMEIKGGEISKGSIQITNYYASAGAIWLDNTSLTMTGGKIIDNFVKPASGQAGNGGAIVSWNGSTIEIIGGEISGNYIDTEDITQCVGGAIHLGSTAGSIKIGGNAYIPEGATDSNGSFATGFGRNDIFLLSESKVVIIKSHLSKAQTIALSLRSDSCTNGAEVLTLDTGANTTIPDEYQKFKMNNEGFSIGSDGKLKHSVITTTENAATAIEAMNESGTVVVSGEMTASELSSIKGALTTLKTTSSTTKVSLDLSGVTGIDAIPSEAIKGCSNLESIVLPEGITSIGSSAFSGCSNLESVVLPDSVTTIGGQSFYLCSKLGSITLPQNLETIGGSAFLGCDIAEIEIPSSVTSIGATAFAQCKFTSVTIPASVTSIGYGVFSKCNSLASLTVEEGNSNYVSEDNVLYTKNRDKIVAVAAEKTGDFTIPESVTAIEKYAFSGSKLSSIIITGNVTSIGMDAFMYCSSLTSIEIPSSVTMLDNYAFEYCTSLASVSLPNTLQSLGVSVFRNCYYLTSIEIPASVTSIGETAFYECRNLETVILNHSDAALSVGEQAFYNCTRLSTVNYIGSETQKNSRTITINETGNDYFENATWNYILYTMLPPETDGTAGTSGTYVLFGEWPQTIKAADVEIEEGDSKTVGMYTYYKGTDGEWYAKLPEKAKEENYTYSNGTSVAQGGTSYKYFKVEPIKWRVLTSEYNGNLRKLLFAERVLINFAYYDTTSERTINGATVYPNNYKESRVRAFLNGLSYNASESTNDDYDGNGFLQTAFTSSEQNCIATTTVYNNLTSTGDDANSYVCANTEDKIFLLSKVEAIAYFSVESYRNRNVTDFSIANGIRLDNGSAYWWLRSPDPTYNTAIDDVFPGGGLNYDHVPGDDWGMVPALCLTN